VPPSPTTNIIDVAPATAAPRSVVLTPLGAGVQCAPPSYVTPSAAPATTPRDEEPKLAGREPAAEIRIFCARITSLRASCRRSAKVTSDDAPSLLSLLFLRPLCIGALALACSTASSATTTAAAGDCPAVGSKACPNDAPFSQGDVDDCTNARSSRCSVAYIDYLKCAGAKVTCGSDGKTDNNALTTACGAQLTAYSNCNSGLDAGGD